MEMTCKLTTKDFLKVPGGHQKRVLFINHVSIHLGVRLSCVQQSVKSCFCNLQYSSQSSLAVRKELDWGWSMLQSGCLSPTLTKW